MLAQEKLRLPRKIQKTNDPNLTASGRWRQNIGNMGVIAIPSRSQFHFENSGCYVGLSKIAYYLTDNMCVVMLSQLERRVKEKAAGCGASSELGISHLDIKIMRAEHPRQASHDLIPEDWAWSSTQHYATGEEGAVEIESHWTERRSERLEVYPVVCRRDVS